MGLIRGALLSLFVFTLFPLFPQNDSSRSNPPIPASFTAEISRLETLASGSEVSTSTAAPSSQDRYNAFLALARLHQLSGNPEAALKAYDGALAVFPDDGRALLEQLRFLISLGEYEKAAAAIGVLLGKDREKELLIQGQYLAAQLEAFSSDNTQPLTALAEDPEFAEYRSGIYYTLWKLTGFALYRTLLITEFPQSPEAKIASGSVEFAPTPLWLLYPGRDSIVLANPAPVPQTATALQTAPVPQTTPVSQATPAPAAVSPSVPVAAGPAGQVGPGGSIGPGGAGRVLQTGLFSREENALVLAERLKKAGFEPQIVKRQLSGDDRWAVCVPGGSDLNAEIKKLKDAGFESFPIDKL